MTTFKDRENAFENKFSRDEETRFKIEARAAKAVALWAASLMGKSDGEAEAYVGDIIAADFREAGQEDVIEKLIADLAGKADEPTIRGKLAQALAEAETALVR
ncbi:DUF1476 domain-containing protein [Paenirhodobacter enshiensis]|uniref:Aldolase n=1 Tax=Paenirhodobacter enshiensis TaxID=1105367 RepID=A0A086XQG1_9RHOB|nr:DUF1476 domain-containing protein [Paenirhodobacter enshiensis]KFI24261.1 aldolase [Paenirhodobacter enshiensis]